MDIYINTAGSYLRVKDGMFELENEGGKQKLSPKKVKSIIISVHALITTDVVKLALDNNVDILLTDEFGEPYGRFWFTKFGSTAFIRRRQIEVFESDEGVEIAKEWIINKIDNSIGHLKELKAKRKDTEARIDKNIEMVIELRQKLELVSGTIEDKRNIIMSYEGNAGREYLDALSLMIPEPYKFDGRSYRPAKDEFNCMLNYAFGILYGKVEKACIIAGLDPNIGVLHSDNYNKKSLVFDIIENFRHYAYRAVFKLFSKKEVNKSHFSEIIGGYILNKEGKPVVVNAISEEFNLKVKYHNRNISQMDLIQFKCHEIANKLIGKIEEEGE